MKEPTFIDSVKLYVQGGRGGNGVSGFRPHRKLLRGVPDGGDGGDGGDVLLRADRDEYSLLRLFYAPHQTGGTGGHGGSNRQQGATGQDTVVPVPRGTEVRDDATGEPVADIVEHGAEVPVARGGRGGRGNYRSKGTRERPKPETFLGQAGEERVLRLELKLISDVGLVGYPNAGKSTLLGAISQAHPKVAPYPFTTLHPTIGTLVFDDYSALTMADIPGLVEGAHDGVGLGHTFLRHIERAAFLLFVVDMAGWDGRDPADDYLSLRRELGLHKAALADVPYLVTANKMDLPAAARNLPEFVRRTGVEPLPISAQEKRGIEELRLALHAEFNKRRK